MALLHTKNRQLLDGSLLLLVNLGRYFFLERAAEAGLAALGVRAVAFAALALALVAERLAEEVRLETVLTGAVPAESLESWDLIRAALLG